MLEYTQKDIEKITEEGIVFKDGSTISFEECRNEWAVMHGINAEDRSRFLKRKVHKQFVKMQDILAQFGYTSFDLS